MTDTAKRVERSYAPGARSRSGQPPVGMGEATGFSVRSARPNQPRTWTGPASRLSRDNVKAAGPLNFSLSFGRTGVGRWPSRCSSAIRCASSGLLPAHHHQGASLHEHFIRLPRLWGTACRPRRAGRHEGTLPALRQALRRSLPIHGGAEPGGREQDAVRIRPHPRRAFPKPTNRAGRKAV